MKARAPASPPVVSALRRQGYAWLLGCGPLLLVAGLLLSPGAPHAAPDARVDHGVQAPHVALVQSADTPWAQGSQAPEPTPSTRQPRPGAAYVAPISPRPSPRTLRPTARRQVPIYRVLRSGQAHRSAP